MGGKSEKASEFKISDITKIDKNIFYKNAEIWSYACRTGNAVPDEQAIDWIRRIRYFQWDFEYDEGFNSDEDAKRENSLAQGLADHTGVKVYAWLTRTLYEGIWDDKGDLAYRNDFIEIPHDGADGGWSREMKSLIPFMNEQDKDDLVLWNMNGAKNGVVGAASPKGLSNNVFKFEKQ